MTVLAPADTPPGAAEAPQTLPETLPQPLPLSGLLRDGSRAEHEDAESSTFMSALLSGKVNAAGYACYLSMLREVYAALESVARDLADDPIASAVIDPDLDRLGAIEADLAFWAPSGVASVHSPAVEAYVARIHASASWGGLYVAHHYTRYLGDLSGGQMIAKRVKRQHGFERAGAAFYDFTELGDIAEFKQRYRAVLDELGESLDELERQRMIDEVRAAYRFNTEVFIDMQKSNEAAAV